ncbi:ROK family transcriptional regulator [Nocardiopsis sp. MG754419]|uniref:ROK family transcriptional regulator n=1 Tax=Nocardiopsis sp. MG754419 TaxID=2259865 RepID=UPI0027DB297B|nr:ROK family transcriptional regulator [Nocardiopsis sp. MG754419]
MPVAAGTRYMREVNTTAVLTGLRGVEHSSAPELARETGLSRQAVSRSLSVLAEAGLVEFLAPLRRGVRSGRPAQRVRFRAEAGHVLGVSVTPKEIRVGLADLSGTLLAVHVAALSEYEEVGRVGAARRPAPADVVSRVLAGTVRLALDDAGTGAGGVWHASVGAPGIVDPVSGRVRFTPSMPGITGDVLVRTLREVAGCEIYLDNDVKLATEGELWHGREHRSMVLIHWGERVGAGIVVDGRLHRGAANDAGDLGYLDLFTDAPEVPEAPRRDDTSTLGAFESWTGTAAFADLVRRAARDRGDQALLTRLDEPGRETGAVIEAVVERRPWWRSTRSPAGSRRGSGPSGPSSTRGWWSSPDPWRGAGRRWWRPWRGICGVNVWTRRRSNCPGPARTRWSRAPSTTPSTRSTAPD